MRRHVAAPRPDAVRAQAIDRQDEHVPQGLQDEHRRPVERVVPLGFHVDYWDYIGWKDRFADPDLATDPLPLGQPARPVDPDQGHDTGGTLGMINVVLSCCGP